jgi:hypothetical protein
MLTNDIREVLRECALTKLHLQATKLRHRYHVLFAFPIQSALMASTGTAAVSLPTYLATPETLHQGLQVATGGPVQHVPSAIRESTKNKAAVTGCDDGLACLLPYVFAQATWVSACIASSGSRST